MKTVPRYRLTAIVELDENFPVEPVTRDAIEIMLKARLSVIRIPTLKLTDIQVVDK